MRLVDQNISYPEPDSPQFDKVALLQVVLVELLFLVSLDHGPRLGFADCDGLGSLVFYGDVVE